MDCLSSLGDGVPLSCGLLSSGEGLRLTTLERGGGEALCLLGLLDLLSPLWSLFGGGDLDLLQRN